MASIQDVINKDPEFAYDTVERVLQTTDLQRFLLPDSSEIKIPEGSGRILGITRDEIKERYLTREQLLSNPPANFHLITGPLIDHKLTQVRNKETKGLVFKELVRELSFALAVYATENLPQRQIMISSPVCDGYGTEIDECKPTVVPIWRAGEGMRDGIQSWLSHSRIGSIGMYRHHETLLPVIYYAKLPMGYKVSPDGQVRKRTCYLGDIMTATGASSVPAIEIVKSFGYERIKYLTLFAAPQGINAILMAHPDVEIYTTALDEGLTNNGYIALGSGDAGDRWTGTK